MSSNIDFYSLLQKAARAVEARYGVIVTQEALSTLMTRVEQHRNQIQKQLDSGFGEVDFENAAYEQLSEAARLIINRFSQTASFFLIDPTQLTQTVSASAVNVSMQVQCHWIPWC